MEKPISDLLVPIVKEVYSDAVAPAMREFGKIGADALKVARLALFPVQYGAMLQDRLARYLDKALEKVPESQRVSPRDAIMLPVAERLRYQDEEGNPIAALYVNLLPRAMDRERLGDAHPAFVHLIEQLAPDEVLILGQLSEMDYRAFVRLAPSTPAVTREEAYGLVYQSQASDGMATRILNAAFEPEALAQPELFLTLLEHLVSLGIVEYTNEPRTIDLSRNQLGFEVFFLRLTDFGRLFHRACVESETAAPSMRQSAE